MSYRSQLVSFDKNPAKIDILVLDASNKLFATQVGKPGETEKIVKVPEQGAFIVVAMIAGKAIAGAESTGVYVPTLHLDTPKPVEQTKPEITPEPAKPAPEVAKPEPAKPAPEVAKPEPAKVEPTVA